MPRIIAYVFPNRAPGNSLPALALVLAAALGLITLPPRAAHAQGFGVYEHGTCEMGRAGATVAQPCNAATAMFYNPAAVAGTQGFTVSGGLTVVAAVGSFTDDLTGTEVELQNGPIPVPHLYAQYGVNERLGVGLGVFVPYGLGTKWPTDDNFPGRFLGYDNDLQSIYVQPTVAYQVTDRLAVGAGVDVVFGAVKLTQRIDLSEQDVPGAGVTFAQLGIPTDTDFGNVQLEGSGVGFGGHVGVRFEATDWLDVGARFLAPVTVTYEGDADFEQVPTNIVLPPNSPIARSRPDIPNDQPLPLDNVVAGSFQEGGPLVDQGVETEITLPAQFVGGVAVQATPQLLLLLDYQWTGWSSFDRLPLAFEHEALNREQVEDFEDTHGVRLGAEYAVNDAFSLRAGYLTHNAAAPEQTVTPLLPEAYRNEYTVGLGWRPSATVQIDAAYQFINQNDRRGRVREIEEGDFDTKVDNEGLYTFDAHLFGATVTLRF